MVNVRGQTERPERPSPQEAPCPEAVLFRTVFGEPENAASYLRTALPPELAELFDLDQLKLCPGSFVDEELRSRHIDLLFTAPLGRHNAYIYLLLEYGDRPHPLMAFKILSYQMRIWDQYLADNPGAVKIPAVIPVVIRCTAEPGNDSLGTLFPSTLSISPTSPTSPGRSPKPPRSNARARDGDTVRTGRPTGTGTGAEPP